MEKLTSFEFNRQPGAAKRMADRGPVLITEYNRPTHVLLSIKDYEAIVAATPMLRVCPACNAQVGQPCTTPSSTSRRPVKWFHYAREEA